MIKKGPLHRSGPFACYSGIVTLADFKCPDLLVAFNDMDRARDARVKGPHHAGGLDRVLRVRYRRADEGLLDRAP